MDKPIHNVTERSLEGQYRNNQKVGVWKLWDKDHKLLQTREYDNNLEYSIIKNDKVVSSSPQLSRNTDGLYDHGELHESDIAYALRLWKNFSEEYIQSNSMLTYSLSIIPFNDFKAYYDDELRHADSTNIAKSKDYSSVYNLRILGDWYYDKKRGLSQFEIIAISPIFDEDTTELWFYYPEMRKALSEIQVESSNEHVFNLDDLLYLSDYGSNIYQVEGAPNTTLEEDKQELQTKAMYEKLLMVEAANWLK